MAINLSTTLQRSSTFSPLSHMIAVNQPIKTSDGARSTFCTGTCTVGVRSAMQINEKQINVLHISRIFLKSMFYIIKINLEIILFRMDCFKVDIAELFIFKFLLS
jgi:hypothetical protein